MPIHNADIAAIFEQIADLLEIEGANSFRVRAYRSAARQLTGMGEAVSDLVARGADLTEIPTIGEDLAAKMREIVATGTCRTLDALRQEIPPSVSDLLKIPGLGPKRVRTLHRELDIQSLEQLARAAQDGRIRGIPGFGAKTEQAILQAVAAHAAGGGRIKLAVAAQYAEPLREYLQHAPGAEQVEIAGSYRRCRETVGDIDILVAARHSPGVMKAFVAYDEVSQVVAQGPTRATVLLKSGLQVDLRVVVPESFGAALHYFTGSKAHNIEIRRLGQERGLKVNEYGVYRGKRKIAGETEESVYRVFGMAWIPPELRENRGELEAARSGKLPRLVARPDLKGDLHAHTRETDGNATLAEMAEAARSCGFEYLAITDHSRRLTVARGLDPRRLRRQMAEIDRLNATMKGIRLLKGIEVDILDDGTLDLPDDVLGELDLVVGAVHSKFNLSRSQQTERILRAMEHPSFTILAHPTGRLLETREPYDVDLPRIIRQARERGCFLELNAHPERLDLLDVYCQMAKEAGVRVSIDSDAHRVQDFQNLKYAVGQARRGWLEARDVLNTRPLHLLLPMLRKTTRRP